MSASGQTRQFDLLSVTSGLHPTADISGRGQHFAFVPNADMRKRYREPNDVERSCHNLRAGARVLAGNLHPAFGGRPAATSPECAQSHILAAYLVAKSAYRGDAFRKLLG